MALSMVAPSSASAQSVEDLTAQINSLLATIASLQTQLAGMTGGDTSGGSSSSVCPFAWTTDLTTGAQGPDVMKLQKFLNSNPATAVAASGVGSMGNETDYFGGLTAAAVASFQNVHAAQVLTPVGLTSGTGYFGPSTRAHMNSLCTSAPVVDDSADDSADDSSDDSDDTASGTGVTLGSGSQPANSIAPLGASRVPFTVFTLTAGSDGPVTISNVTVERTGFADNSNISGVVLLGPDMEQLGNAKTLNSNNQAKVGTSYTIPAGATHTFTIAGNRPATMAVSKDGQVASLSLVAVNTSASVSGSLPITGASHVMNESLTIGSAEVSVGPSDKDSAGMSEEIGKTNELFGAIRVTNNSSQEDVRVRTIRWQQTGSASSNDIANIRTVVDGVEYPAVADGDFYTSTLGSGIVVAEGFNKEFVLRGDIVGGSGRNVNFVIDENTDLYVTGETYGFGVNPTQVEDGTVSDASEMTAGTPFFSGSVFAINAGSMTSFSKSNDVPAQNVAINVPNQPLGAFEADIKGEALTVQSMAFNFTIGGSPVGTDVDNVTLVDGNGAVIAGPVDMTGATASGVVTFTDTVTLPVGKSTLTLKGKLDNSFGNDDTIQASTTPSAWTGVKGEDTGDTVTLTNGATNANVMTVKAAAGSAKVATSPTSQNVVGGVSGMVVSTIQLDGSQSGEDVRYTSVQLRYTNTGGDPTNCRLYDGDTQLTDDGVNPTATGAQTFGLDTPVVVAKGTIKSLDVKCDISSSVADGSTFSFGVNSADTISGTGVDSGTSVDASDNTNVGPTMTVTGSGSLTVTLDSSSPSYKLAAAGTSDVTLAVLKLTATNEDIRLDRMGLQLSNTSASSSASDLMTVGIYDGSTMVASAVFSGSSRYATTTLTETVIVPKDGTKNLTVKATMSDIGSSQPGTQGALVQVDFDGDDSTATKGVGQDSGTTVYATGADTAAAGVRLFRSFPTFAQESFVSNDQSAESNADLLRFSVTADASGDVLIGKFTLRVSTTSAVVSNVNVHAYQNGYDNSPVSVISGSDGEMVASDVDPVGPLLDMDFVVDNNSDEYVTVPAGQTRYFIVKGDIDSITANSGSVKVTVLGDVAYPSFSPAALMGTVATVDAGAVDNFIWSPMATTTIAVDSVDWTNGFRTSGLPADGFSQTVSNQ